ncbi:hypothetical protein NFI96_028154 [Prochilodus magdalenae]|nr:hypothetical protein NFI96_028154 [Prochilodus magdalenae]
MTNGGKSTLSQKSLQEMLPNSCIISQDSFFQSNPSPPFPPFNILLLCGEGSRETWSVLLQCLAGQVSSWAETDSRETWSVLLQCLAGQVSSWPETDSRETWSVLLQCLAGQDDAVVPVDSHGFKQYDTLDALHMDRMMSKVRSWVQDPRSFMLSQGLAVQESGVFSLLVEGFLIFNYGSRVYKPPDPVGYFDGHVWPMYLKNRKEMEEAVQDLVFLDGTQRMEDLLATVSEDILQMCTAVEK